MAQPEVKKEHRASYVSDLQRMAYVGITGSGSASSVFQSIEGSDRKLEFVGCGLATCGERWSRHNVDAMQWLTASGYTEDEAIGLHKRRHAAALQMMADDTTPSRGLGSYVRERSAKRRSQGGDLG